MAAYATIAWKTLILTTMGLALAIVTLALGLVFTTGFGADRPAQVVAVTLLLCCSGAAAGSGIATIYAMMAAGGGLLLKTGPGAVWAFLAVLTAAALLCTAGAWISDRHIRPRRQSARVAGWEPGLELKCENG